ncbi:nuclear transport factor 2 family protein [Granulicoccus phenolivorans]|uniref:nuclear transport factor 2 family protein n=1 Tax=Granulicoccus phenolivorans TaxID=266854 RepID=UPI00042796F5|nr:nuclear transport factor 2 family protein [Granulicoccus phenolivorans]
MTQQEILDLGRRWVAAEQAGDAAALDRLGATGFRLVGPVGFVLDREQWLDRYRGDRALKLEEVQWSDVEVQEFGDTAIAIGVQTQRGSYAGHPADGKFRVTQVLIRDDGQWQLAGLHFSPIGGPPPFAAR